MGKEQNINKIFKILKKENPSPTTELNYKDVFTLLVAVVLSAQSTDKGVNKVTEKLFKKVGNNLRKKKTNTKKPNN